jgi:hypothetical protein
MLASFSQRVARIGPNSWHSRRSSESDPGVTQLEALVTILLVLLVIAFPSLIGLGILVWLER